MSPTSYPLPKTAIAVPLLASITLVLDTAPLIWHVRNRNLAASMLVFYVILVNFMNLINSLIWPRDNFMDWWQGQGLCDIEVKLINVIYVGAAGCLLSIMRTLARALNTDTAVIFLSKGQKRKRLAIDLTLCVGLPLLMVPLHYMIQPFRYWIGTVAGCIAPYDNSWLSYVLILVWPPVLSVGAVVYSGIVIYRMYVYRRDFSAVLQSASSGLSRDRFLRLFAMSTTMIIVFLPVQLVLIGRTARNKLLPYSWDAVHDPSQWNDIGLVPTGGYVAFDRWIQIAFGFAVFLFFGLGRDAQRMYCGWLLALGFGRIFPSLKPKPKAATFASTTTYTGTGARTTLGSRARLLFKKSGHSNSPTNIPKATYQTTIQKPEMAGRISDDSETVSSPMSDMFITKADVAGAASPPEEDENSPSWLRKAYVSTSTTMSIRQMGGLGHFGISNPPKARVNSNDSIV